MFHPHDTLLDTIFGELSTDILQSYYMTPRLQDLYYKWIDNPHSEEAHKIIEDLVSLFSEML